MRGNASELAPAGISGPRAADGAFARWSKGGELTLDDLLADPLVRLVMVRDRVKIADVQALFASVRRDRAHATSPSPF